MKLFILLTIITTSVLSTSCKSQKTATYWVNSSKFECDAGEAIMQCLQIKKSENLEKGNWEYFYDEIEGFTFKPGVFQKIEVKETALDLKDVPADASSIKFSLVKILEEHQDIRYAIHDIWVAKKVFGKKITTNMKMPNLEINITKMTVHGNDGCNAFNGSIPVLKDNNIEFGPLMATRRYCGDGNVSIKFNKALSETKSFKREGLNLIFLNENNEETIQFLKVD